MIGQEREVDDAGQPVSEEQEENAADTVKTILW